MLCVVAVEVALSSPITSSGGPSIYSLCMCVRVARYSACEVAWHMWEETVEATAQGKQTAGCCFGAVYLFLYNSVFVPRTIFFAGVKSHQVVFRRSSLSRFNAPCTRSNDGCGGYVRSPHVTCPCGVLQVRQTTAAALRPYLTN